MARFSLMILAAVMVMAVWPADHADARRFGGGLSFGSHHRAFAPSHARAPSRHATTQRGSRPTAGMQPPRRSGWMGAIAGLAMGGLLGAMLFGGAFNGINLMDIVVIGAIGFGLMWWFRRKAEALAAQQASYANAAADSGNRNYFAPDTDASGTATQPDTAKPDIDRRQFLDAARAIFVRMQSAWDQQDLDEIRRFCLPEVVAHVEQQLRQQQGQRNITEVVTLDAELLDSWIESGDEWAAVAFTAMMKEETLASDGQLLETANARVEEIWTFRHDPRSDDPTWFVAGIAQQP